MPIYLVECHGEARELYHVEADTPEEAMTNWHTGQLHLSEASGMEPVTAEHVED